jgi:hypothetical protein
MTDRLAEIRERLAKATHGPFKLFEIIADEDYHIRLTEDEATLVATATDRDGANLYFHAPEDLKFLLSEVDRLRAIEEAAGKMAELLSVFELSECLCEMAPDPKGRNLHYDACPVGEAKEITSLPAVQSLLSRRKAGEQEGGKK